MIFNDLLFIDIETVSEKSDFNELPDRVKPLWAQKAKYLTKEDVPDVNALYTEKAGVFAEFAKVVCIGLGFIINGTNGTQELRVKVLKNNCEKTLLKEFVDLLPRFNEESLTFCGHNIREFDIPFLCRRLVVNGLSVPYVLDYSGKKPWEVNVKDTMQMWRYGDYKNYTSLEMMASILGVPSSKSDMDGSCVGEAYHSYGKLDDISDYCGLDVSVTAQVYLRLTGGELLSEEQIVFL